MNFREFVLKHETTVKPLEKEIALAHWGGATTGSKRDYAKLSRLHFKFEEVYTSREDFAFVGKAREKGDFENEKFARIADILYLRYLGKQTDLSFLEEITKLASGLEQRFNVFRTELEGNELTQNDVAGILAGEIDSTKRRLAWEGHKRVGELLEEDLIRLVELRNKSAVKAGFDNFYSMSLYLTEQNEDDLVTLFDNLEQITREPFRALKKELDKGLSELYGIPEEQMMPWHYSDLYFQELPQLSSIDFDRFYRGRNPAGIAEEFYKSIGMQVGDILARSDLYERGGKSPHAFCTDIDRCGDIRILCNIKDTVRWMDTVLHELGHAVYDKYIDRSLPFFLRTYPHLCLTEASAMFFGALATDPLWMKSALDLSREEADEIAPAAGKALSGKHLVFARWCQVMFRFERELYRDPHRNLNALWWDIVQKYQFVTPPPGRDKPDWATKIHIVTSPVYYHNYMLGELIAAQFRHYIEVNDLGGGAENSIRIYGNQAVSKYFIDRIFREGNLLPWDKFIEKATGEPLKVDYLASLFVKGKN